MFGSTDGREVIMNFFHQFGEKYGQLGQFERQTDRQADKVSCLYILIGKPANVQNISFLNSAWHHGEQNTI